MAIRQSVEYGLQAPKTQSNHHLTSSAMFANRLFPAPDVLEAFKPFCLATADERGVVLIEPYRPSPPLKLVYSSYDEETKTNRASLSFKQYGDLSTFLRRALKISAPILDVQVLATPTSLLVNFGVDPRVLHGDAIYPCNHPGLSILFATGSKIAILWDVDASNITWPSWVERPTF